MLFKITRTVRCGSLLIKITFEQSEDPPCEIMTEHADEVESAVRETYDGTEKHSSMVAFEIVDRYRRVHSAEVEDEETGDIVSCTFDEDF
jgi:hypothetical protein